MNHRPVWPQRATLLPVIQLLVEFFKGLSNYYDLKEWKVWMAPFHKPRFSDEIKDRALYVFPVEDGSMLATSSFN